MTLFLLRRCRRSPPGSGGGGGATLAPVKTHRRRGVALLVLAALLIAVGASLWLRFSTPWELDPPRPQVGADAPDTLAVSPLSIVEAPVSYDLDTAIDSLEAAVPLTYGDLETRLPVADHPRASFAFELKRSPFTVTVSGQTVSISTVVEYAGRAWYKPLVGPELSASCGTGDDPRPRVRATLVSTGRLTSSWQLRTRTRLLQLEPYSEEPRDRCRLTLLRIDVTDRVVEGTRGMLEQHLRQFDDAVARWPVRPRFEKLWTLLQRPIWLTDSVYLMIRPSAAQLGPIECDGHTVVARLRLIASPRIITGRRPDVRDIVYIIPPLETTPYVGNGAYVSLEASIAYPVATTMLRRALVGRRLEQSGHHVRIRNVELTGVGGGRMALALTVDGAARGTLYFVGTPVIDRANHQISVPDLDYDVGTADLLVRGVGWLQGVDIRDFLRERARLPDSAVVGQLSDLAQRGINRTLTPGVELSGTILAVQATSAYATKQDIRIRAEADAQLSLAINKAPSIPRPPRTTEPRR